MLLINFKTYESSTGINALTLAQTAKLVNQNIIICPAITDLQSVSQVGVETWAQHVDPYEVGRATGYILPEMIKAAGAVGTLLNHSEHKLDFEILTQSHLRAKALGLKTLIFAQDLDEAKKVSQLNPDYVGYEPPELVASTQTSVSKAKPEVIKSVVDALPNQKILVGAGIKDIDDVKVSIELGAVAIGVASAITESPDPKAKIEELVKLFI